MSNSNEHPARNYDQFSPLSPPRLYNKPQKFSFKTIVKNLEQEQDFPSNILNFYRGHLRKEL